MAPPREAANRRPIKAGAPTGRVTTRSVQPHEAAALAALRASPPFSRAAKATREALAREASAEDFASGDCVLHPGTPRTTVDVVSRGRVRVDRGDGDDAMPLGYRGAHDVLDEASFGVAGRYEVGAYALEPVTLLRVPIAAVRKAEAEDNALGAAVLALLVARRRETEDRAESLLFRSVEGRLAELLVQVAARWGVPSPRGSLISIPLTHLEIARLIGSTRETVTLTIGSLRRAGLLDVAGRRIIVRDAAALSARG